MYIIVMTQNRKVEISSLTMNISRFPLHNQPHALYHAEQLPSESTRHHITFSLIMDIRKLLEGKSGQAPTANLIDQYQSVLQSLPWNQSNTVDIKRYIDHIIDLPYGRNFAKPLIDHALAISEARLSESESPSSDILLYLLSKLAPLSIPYLDQDLRARNVLATYFESNDDNLQAAQVLLDGMDTDRRAIPDVVRFETYIRIVRNYLECDRTELAQSVLSRAAISRSNLETVPPESEIHFVLCQARILDSNRKFLDASVKYYTVSRESLVSEADRRICLRQSIICAILSPAGPARSQQLRRLYMDEGALQDPTLFGILEKVYLGRLLSEEDINVLQQVLSPHQLVVVEDGITVLQRAIVDHNVLSVSKVYDNISLDVLSRTLGLDPAKAEAYSARMISQDRLNARIDQIDRLVYFEESVNSTGASKELNLRDQSILKMCNQLEDIVTMIQKRHPDIQFT